MTLSNVRDELESENLCRVVKDGRSRYLQFKQERRDVWETAKPRLRSPVRTGHWVRWSEPSKWTLVSGVTALAELSLISGDPLPSFALHDRRYRKLLEIGDIQGCPGPDEASARIEAWKYDPTVLTDEHTVDKLSLYLSLQQSGEERIQAALEELLDGMPW